MWTVNELIVAAGAGAIVGYVLISIIQGVLKLIFNNDDKRNQSAGRRENT